jgi:hypothetical protein
MPIIYILFITWRVFGLHSIQNPAFASLLNSSLSCLLMTQQAIIISPSIVSALKVMLFIAFDLVCGLVK